jgi:hypothetical protein
MQKGAQAPREVAGGRPPKQAAQSLDGTRLSVRRQAVDESVESCSVGDCSIGAHRSGVLPGAGRRGRPLRWRSLRRRGPLHGRGPLRSRRSLRGRSLRRTCIRRTAGGVGSTALGRGVLGMARSLVDLDRRTLVGHAGLPGLDMDRTAVGLGRNGVGLAGGVLGTVELDGESQWGKS